MPWLYGQLTCVCKRRFPIEFDTITSHESLRVLNVFDITHLWSNLLITATKNIQGIGYLTLVVITGTTILDPYLYVKSLQLIWRSGTRKFRRRVPDHQKVCRDLTKWQYTRIVAPAMAAGRRAESMMTSSNGNIFRVTGPLCGEFTGPGEFPAQRPVTRSVGVFFDLHLNKRLSKQS